MDDDPLRMYLVSGAAAIESIARGGELAGAAAVACVRSFADDPALREWRPRPGKVTLRARGGQWDRGCWRSRTSSRVTRMARA